LPRASVLMRAEGTREKTLAANIDQIAIVFAARPGFNPHFVWRALLAAHGAHIGALAILNKNDHKEKQKHEKHTHRHERQSDRQHKKQARHEKQENYGQPKPHPKPCKEEPESSAKEEYGRWDGGKDATGGKCPQREP